MGEEKPKTGCECPLAGLCNRHGVEKTPHLHKLCQNHVGYFNMWEECRGPRQNKNNCDKSPETKSEIPLVDTSPKITPVVVEDVKMPSLIQQGKNLLKATKTHIANGMKHVTLEEQNRRLSICNACPLFDKSLMKCKKCGCNLNVKTKWESSTCPIGQW